MATLGQRIKELREKNSLTQKEVSSLLGFKSTRAIQYVEADERGMDYRDLIKLADHFHVSIDYLVGRTDNPQLHE
jgi:transcriptional regulator with XRE-family HTH domain